MTDTPSWPQNRVLLALPRRDFKQLLPQLTRIPCRREQVLTDADSSLDHVYFPDSGVVSVVAVYSDGSIIEMATIGREGCTGVQAVFGAKIFLCSVPRSNPGKRHPDVAGSVRTCDAVDAFLPPSGVWVRPSLSRAGNGVGSVQRCA